MEACYLYVFKPADYNANVGDRFIVYDDKLKKVYKRIIIDSENNIELRDAKVLNNIDSFKFKFQVKKDDIWKDSYRYFKLFKRQLGDYLTDLEKINDNVIINFITYYNHSKTTNSRTKFLKSIKQVSEDLWLRHQKKHANLVYYLGFVEKNRNLFNLEWENINIYFKHLHKLKVEFQKYGYHNLYFYDLQPALFNNEDLIEFMNNQIKELEEANLQFAYLLIAQYFSLLNDREKASEYFKKVRSYDNNLEREFLVGQGSATYNTLDENRQKHDLNVTFDSEKIDFDTNNTILCSVDSKYLKRYGTIIFFNVIALQKYHFHIHVVGDNENTISTINEAKALFTQMKSFVGKESEIIPPTFSYEELPDYTNSIKTYSATARFINASYFMEKFNSNLLILDADMFLTDDLTKYFNSIKPFDVAIAFSKSITTTMPWRRLMAGNIYLTNNSKAKAFIDLTRDYIVDNLKEQNSWTLDQNALSFAYENIFKLYPDINFGNTYELKRPFSHPSIRTYIERN